MSLTDFKLLYGLVPNYLRIDYHSLIDCMNDEFKMKVLEFWLDQPDQIGIIPKNLKKEITEEDIDYLIAEIGEKVIDSSAVFEHLEKIRKRVYEKQTFELQKNSIRTQKIQTWVIVILTVLSVILTGVNVSIAYFNYRNMIEYQKPFTIPSISYCPEEFPPPLFFYNFEVRNIGRSAGIISNLTIDNKSSTYTISPNEKSIIVPPDEAILFNLNMWPKGNKNFDFTIIVTTERGCFQKTCNYKWDSKVYYYKKINEDTWYGC